jgi:hypothetical protein
MFSPLKKRFFAAYARLKYPAPAWRWLNSRAVRNFEAHPPELDETQSRILSDLGATGIATATLDELFPDEDMLARLCAYATTRETSATTNHKKPFLMDYWPETRALDQENPFLEVALSPRMLDIANAYLGMFSTLMDFYLQKSSKVSEERTHSQNWHRDPQEIRLCKVFLYLNDVGPENGPFVYIKDSVRGKKYGNLFPQEIPAGVYPDPAKLESLIPESERTAMTGKAGTVIFCDTTGLHYGGVVREGHRLMATLVYGAPSYRENQTYWYESAFKTWVAKQPISTQFAIRPKWERKP